MDRPSQAGYAALFMTVEEGAADYVQAYLNKGFQIF